MTVKSKRLAISSASLALLLATAVAQRGRPSQPTSISNFLLNETKPYVYLEFDHIGPREPSRADEPHTGLWLRLHNNCIVPIIVNTFGSPPNSDPQEMGVFDNVVKNPDPALGEGGVAVTVLPQSSDQILNEVLGGSVSVPKANELPPTVPRENLEDKMPNGYMFEVSSFITIPPGKAIYFSVPVNHVSKTWHFEVPFRFAVERHGSTRWPDSSIAFYWHDLPESYRANLASPN